ncbi:MAG TPA: hypothetical protein VGR62_02350 [Candidatus Binatia bacterium]|jgi:hypothetical protein|nr:hypothetical protein [Candidatus Binatia bacterium]
MTLAAAVLLAAVLAAPVHAADEAPASVVSVKGERLTVRVNAMSLDDVLQRFATATGAEIRGGVATPRDVSVEFEDVPVQDGLARLLGDQNFMLTYRDGKLSRLTLLGGALDAPVTKVVKTEHGGGGSETPQTFAQLIQSRTVEVTPGGRLSRFLGKDSATLQQLIDIGLRNDDRAVRTEAMRMSIQAIDGQPDLQTATVEAIGAMDDNQLMGMFRATARDHTKEVLSQMATMLRTNELRTRSLRLLMQANTPLGAAPTE